MTLHTDTANHETSRAECAAFATREAGPYAAYVSMDGKRIVTFTGDTLGTITSTGRPQRISGYLSTALTPFRAVGIDGRTYFGRMHGPGLYVRLRVAKSH